MTNTPELLWAELGSAFGWRPEAAADAFARLRDAYVEPHRFYHDWAHVESVVAELGPSPSPALTLAALYHDAVYEAGSSQNELASAEMAEVELTALGVPDGLCERVRELILATQTHSAPPGDADLDALLDADLAVLGAEPEGYARYVVAIRREFAHVPSAHFAEGRAVILRALLDRPRLYRRPDAQVRWEVRARENVRAELAHLEGEAATGRERE